LRNFLLPVGKKNRYTQVAPVAIKMRPMLSQLCETLLL